MLSNSGVFYRFRPTNGRGDGGRGKPSPGPLSTEHENLPYKVELWDEARVAVEQVLAVTANGSIGQTEHPARRITLRRGARLIADTTE